MMSKPLSVRCTLGLHRYRWIFVGSGWQANDFVLACTRCGWEKGY